MTLLETLRAHRGGILRIKSQLYWYGGRGWDGTPDRICLVLDATDSAAVPVTVSVTRAFVYAEFCAITALLLIDGRPHWVWIGPEDVELIT